MRAERQENEVPELDDDRIPDGWATARLGSLCRLVNGRAFKPSEWTKSGLPIIRIQNLNDPRAKFNHYSGPIDSRHRVETGELLFAWSGTPGTSFGAHIWKGESAVLNQHIFRVVFAEGLLNKNYLRLAINQRLNDLVHAAHGGAGLAHVTKDVVEATELLIAPIQEQQRIVTKVSSLLEALSTCSNRLDRVQRLLRLFRQAVLAAAFSGRLTEGWRDRNSSTRSVVAMLKERRSRSTRSTSHRSRKGTASVPDANALPAIPDTWAWAWLPELGELNRGRSRHRPRNDPRLYGGSYPFVQTGDIARSRGRVVSHSQTYSQEGLDQSRLWPAGTVCITIAANIAESAILTYPACFPDSVVGLLVDPDVCLAEYAEFFVRTARSDLAQYAPATAQANINLEILREVAVPLPPAEEQSEMVQRINRLLAYADSVERIVFTSSTRLEAIVQSVLAKAFRGELVPTEAALAEKEGRYYESGGELVERIRRETRGQVSGDGQSARASRRGRTRSPIAGSASRRRPGPVAAGA